MKNYNGLNGYTKYLGIVTGEEFEQAYNDMSDSPDKLPIASTILPVHTIPLNEDAKPLAQAWIFYQTKKEEEEKKMRLDL